MSSQPERSVAEEIAQPWTATKASIVRADYQIRYGVCRTSVIQYIQTLSHHQKTF